jgi:hypothetical protein
MQMKALVIRVKRYGYKLDLELRLTTYESGG